MRAILDVFCWLVVVAVVGLLARKQLGTLSAGRRPASWNIFQRFFTGCHAAAAKRAISRPDQKVGRRCDAADAPGAGQPVKGLILRTDALRVMLLGLTLVASMGDVMATLGQAPTTFPASSTLPPAVGAKRLAATPTARSTLYELHEVQLENGTTLREYAMPAGVVFAVAWRGPVLPDLSALLGGYFNTFKLETEQARRMGKRGAPVKIERDDLVVRSSGRMRNFFGHAYAPDLIPAGVNINDLLQ